MTTVNGKNHWQLLQKLASEKRVSEAVVFFRCGGVEPLLIKGWWAAQFYDEPAERYYTDIDLAFSAADYPRAIEIEKEYRAAKPRALAVDLHRETRHLDTLEYERLFKESRLVECGDVSIRVPRPEDHLRILCVHWLNDGGENRRRLWDVYYQVANRPADFDWARCLDVVSPTRRRWIVCALAVAHKYLNLPLEGTPAAGTADEIPAWVVETLEKAWAKDEILMPLQNCLNDRRLLWRQIKKRIPPNPIQATVETEGEFDDGWRLPYQIADIKLRLAPSFRRFADKIRLKK